MAQAFVGVGGVPRNITEIKVGVGGAVRNVTEAYVGVNGAPRLAWAGNKWANKLYCLHTQTSSPATFRIYQIEPTSYIASLVVDRILYSDLSTTIPSGVFTSSGGLGAGVGTFNRYVAWGNTGYHSFATSIDPFIVTKRYFWSDPEDGGYLIFGFKREYHKGYTYGALGQYTTNQLTKIDELTNLSTACVFPTVVAANYPVANSKSVFLAPSLYAAGIIHRVDSFVPNGTGTTSPMYTVISVPVTANDKYLFCTTQASPGKAVFTVDIPTGVVVSSGQTPGTSGRHYMFSPKTK